MAMPNASAFVYDVGQLSSANVYFFRILPYTRNPYQTATGSCKVVMYRTADHVEEKYFFVSSFRCHGRTTVAVVVIKVSE